MVSLLADLRDKPEAAAVEVLNPLVVHMITGLSEYLV
jgi:hypothetical protein